MGVHGHFTTKCFTERGEKKKKTLTTKDKMGLSSWQYVCLRRKFRKISALRSVEWSRKQTQMRPNTPNSSCTCWSCLSWNKEPNQVLHMDLKLALDSTMIFFLFSLSFSLNRRREDSKITVFVFLFFIFYFGRSLAGFQDNLARLDDLLGYM